MLPNSWRRLLSLIRILLGMSCLATQLIASGFVWTDTVILFAVYVIYACVVLFWRSLEDAGYSNVALLIDFGFFFLSAISSAAYAYWITSVFYAYVLLVAVMLHNWWKTLALAVTAVLLLYLVPTLHSSEILRPALMATMAMEDVSRAYEKGETKGFMKILVDQETKQILGAALLGLSGDEVIHCILDTMYAKAPSTVLQRAMHIHPTVSEFVPTMLDDLAPLQ